jgi:DNA polymerase type B, organellar and viral
MQVIPPIRAENMARTNAEKQRAYRQRGGQKLRIADAARKRETRKAAAGIPPFIGVDGEGIGKGENHRYVLLGVGDQQYENPRGIHWEEAFHFLYGQFKRQPSAAFVGFYLSYDLNEILKTLPFEAARMLLTREGKALRKKKNRQQSRTSYWPVRLPGWELDMLGFKRLSIRPRPEGCNCAEGKVKCTHKQYPWMHVCDVGSFFQMSFLNALDKWKDDKELGPVCSREEYRDIERGKARRDHAELDDEMRAYNIKENLLLSRVMHRLAQGFAAVDIKLSRDQWYGPGATASKWLSTHHAVKRRELRTKDDNGKVLMPKWFWDACRYSYYGGWFEIFSHGIISGTSYNYDINSAYPFATTKLPHICDECRYRRGHGAYKGDGTKVLLYATVFSAGDRIGAVPYRDKTGSILRPRVAKGWYWRFELEAAERAGLVKKIIIHEWMEFLPCGHGEPFMKIRELYNQRLEKGKDSAHGMAIKLNINSIYGKFAQLVGGAPYNNWFYASYITAHTRTQILDAIATHPGRSDSVLMVATDGICFDSSHPMLPISKKLGEWAKVEYLDLLLFKPGVYWHKEGKEQLLKVKSRGVPRAELQKKTAAVEYQFELLQRQHAYPGQTVYGISAELQDSLFTLSGQRGWPQFWVEVKFRMKSCKQALNEGKWDTAGRIQEAFPILQDSDPHKKRTRPLYNETKQRIDTHIHDLPIKELQTTYHGDVTPPTPRDLGYNTEGDARGFLLEAFAAMRDKAANYDLPIANLEWTTVWDGHAT